jgi:hypothetical protein
MWWSRFGVGPGGTQVEQVLRVAAYTALMTDEYPPFRLDMGGSEPSALVVAPLDPADRDASDRSGVTSEQVRTSLTPTPPSGHWTTLRITAVVMGSVLLVGGFAAAVGATAVVVADQAGRDSDGFLNTPTRTFISNGYALVFDPVQLQGENATASVGAILGELHIHASSPGPGASVQGASGQGDGVFVGIGPAVAVERYLAGVDRDRLVGLGGGTADQQQLPGGAPATPPAQRAFWVASATGPGPQQLAWTAAQGRWAAAVMDADGTRPVVAELSAGATAPGLRWVWIGLYVGAGIALAGGAALVLLGAFRRRRGPVATGTR